VTNSWLSQCHDSVDWLSDRYILLLPFS